MTRDAGPPVTDLPALAEVRVGAVGADRTETVTERTQQ